MKVKSTYKNDCVYFSHYNVKKVKDNFFGVYRHNILITHSITFGKACKKAKLLEMGYQCGYGDAKDFYSGNDYGDGYYDY
jgi:CRISPR/Cas system endoribonuclease Cas6 (RAMP superfamily)